MLIRFASANVFSLRTRGWQRKRYLPGVTSIHEEIHGTWDGDITHPKPRDDGSRSDIQNTTKFCEKTGLLEEQGPPGYFVTNLSPNLSPNLVMNLVTHQIWCKITNVVMNCIR